MDPLETAILIQSLWTADPSQSEAVRLGDMSLDILKRILDLDDIHHPSNPEWPQLVHSLGEVSSYVLPKETLPVFMSFVQRYIQLDSQILGVVLKWMDHLTGYHGVKYQDGNRLVYSVLQKYVSYDGSNPTSLLICILASRILLRWGFDGDELLEAVSKSENDAANILSATLKLQPIVPKWTMPNGFLNKALKQIMAVDPNEGAAVTAIYGSDYDWVDYSNLDE